MDICEQPAQGFEMTSVVHLNSHRVKHATQIKRACSTTAPHAGLILKASQISIGP
jgi:hypothetical protein